MKVTYYSTLYKEDITRTVFGPIEFKDGYIVFASNGSRYAVDFKDIRKIEATEREQNNDRT